MLGLDDLDGGGVHFLIFVSCMRLDVGSYTVALDAAILSITRSFVPRVRKFISTMM
jgi:hypothetical protein